MMSCGTSSRYGSSLLLKTADFSIQGTCSHKADRVPDRERPPLRSRRGEIGDDLLCGFLEGAQDGVAARHRSVQCFLGCLLSAECSLHLFGPDIAHLHHVAEPQAARIL